MKHKIISIVVMCFINLIIGITYAQELEVIGYNVESGGADPDIVAQRFIEIDGCDIWGLSEVQDQGWANTF